MTDDVARELDKAALNLTLAERQVLSAALGVLLQVVSANRVERQPAPAVHTACETLGSLYILLGHGRAALASLQEAEHRRTLQ